MLELYAIELNEEYRKECNINLSDFVILVENGNPVNNSLYRIGRMRKPKFGVDDYFMLIKYTEGFYKADDNKKVKHLENRFCILDKHGVEKVVFDTYHSVYLLKDSCVYTLNEEYYNIETGELYCTAYKRLESSEFIFLENLYDKDLTKRGIMKINKKDGSYTIYN